MKTMLSRMIHRPEAILFCFIMLLSFSFRCDGNDENYGLNDDQIEMTAEVRERVDYFEITGSLKSLNPSGYCNMLWSYLTIEISDAPDPRLIKFERTVNEITDSTTINDSKWASLHEINISKIPLTPSLQKYDFSIKIYKNVAYKMCLVSLSSWNDNGTEASKTGDGCSGTVGITAERTFPINKTIESL